MNIRDRIEAIRAWSHRGTWWERLLKTAFLHSVVWVGVVYTGGLIGAVCIVVGWLPAYLALVFPLIGFAKGEQFYAFRESAQFGLAWEQRNWRGVLDSLADYWPPLACATGAFYTVAAAYIALGTL